MTLAWMVADREWNSIRGKQTRTLLRLSSQVLRPVAPKLDC